MKKNYTNILLATVLVLLAASSRVIFNEAHIWNIAPIAALGLFSGAVVKDKRFAFLLPLLAQFSADVYFQFFTNTQGFYSISQFFTYAGLIAATMIGFRMNGISAVKVLGFTLASSTAFFLISNFGVWLQGWYGMTLSGLVNTYVLAVPFYKNTLIGDLTGSVILFGMYHLLQNVVVPRLTKSNA
jgi:hypothetical protein